MKNKTLFYDKPANPNIWEEALPLGNGFLGAMVYGGVDDEHIKLNQESVWYGGFRDRVNPDAKEALSSIRQSIFQGNLDEAEMLAYEKMYGTPMSQGHYEPLANLKIVFNRKIAHYSELGQERIKDYTQYKRQLRLDTGVYTCQYNHNHTDYQREVFISHPDKVMVVKLQASGEADLSFRVELERGDMYEELFVEKDCIVLQGVSGGNGPAFSCIVKVLCGSGNVKRAGGALVVTKAKEVTLLVTGTTDYYKHNPYTWCMKTLKQAATKKYEVIKERHIHDFATLFNRVALQIDQNPLDDVPSTDRRLTRYKNDSDDDGMIELYFNYGRYLLISCSREESLPANLQGIWSKDMEPPWGCKYTININTQMNYWPAEITNLSECHMALFKHLKKMAEHGRQVAEKMYGCQGIVAHHNTDIYGDCAPQDQWMPATIWPMGMAWLATHIIEHYRFKLDQGFALDYYDILSDTVLFLSEFLIKDENNQYVTCPSTSPENTYVLDNGEKSALCYGPTMDSQIIRHLFEGYLEISEGLQKSGIMVSKVREMIEFLPETRIGSKGQILEWTKEYKEWEEGHRHISHLYGLRPGDSITKTKSKALFEAAKVTLKQRLSSGGGHTGWSRAWIINFYARLFDGELAFENIKALLHHSTAINLFDMHPPFQIDGNFGGTAGIAEMLLQSHEGMIRLLPALPSKWKTGWVKGLKARGNIEVDIWWEDGQLIKVVFKSPISQKVKISYRDIENDIMLEVNEDYLMFIK